MAEAGAASVEQQPGSLLAEAVAGTIGGVAGILTGSPLDVIKTRVQSGVQGAHLGMRATAAAILRNEGASAFFKGSLAAAISQVPNNFITFFTWGAGLRIAAAVDLAGRLGVRSDAELREAVHIFAAGSLSGSLQSFALGPFEHLKIQQQVTAPVRLGLVAATRALLDAGGARLLFRGTAATLLRDGPVYGAYFLTYEWFKQYFALLAAAGARGEADGARAAAARAQLDAWAMLTNTAVPVPAWSMLAAGAVAGVLSWLLALPVDVVKSRVQAAPVDAPPSSTRILAVAARLYAEGGVPIFFRGLVPCLVRAAPVNAVTFVGFEMAHQLIQERLLLR
jgi:solute carrier family 25 (mitochondrial carnitine/acylcarnitine transporter), member 20/29